MSNNTKLDEEIMMNSECRHKKENCDLCGAQKFSPVAMEAGHTIYKCQACGLVQVRPLPEETKEINQLYWKVNLDDASVRIARLGSIRVFNYGIKLIKKFSGGSIREKRILDVGCGMGLFLELVQKEGAEPHGIDLTAEAVQMSSALCKIDTVKQGYFESCGFASGFFHVITGWGVLHHTRHPSQWLARAYELLSDDGILLVKGPNVSCTSLLYRMSPLLRLLHLPVPNYMASKPPLNLYGFSCNTLKESMKKAGFEVLMAGRAPAGDKTKLYGKVATVFSRLVSLITFGMVNIHPVIMAIGRKRKNESSV